MPDPSRIETSQPSPDYDQKAAPQESGAELQEKSSELQPTPLDKSTPDVSAPPLPSEKLDGAEEWEQQISTVESNLEKEHKKEFDDSDTLKVPKSEIEEMPVEESKVESEIQDNSVIASERKTDSSRQHTQVVDSSQQKNSWHEETMAKTEELPIVESPRRGPNQPVESGIIQSGIKLPSQVNMLAKDTAQEAGMSFTSVVAKGIALMALILKIKKQGFRLAVIDNNDDVVADIEGIEGDI